MMLRKTFSVLAFGAALLLVGAGCTGGDRGKDSSAPISDGSSGARTNVPLAPSVVSEPVTNTKDFPVDYSMGGLRVETTPVLIGDTETKGGIVAPTIISMSAGSFVPAKLTIAVGTTVEFVNNDTTGHWPASDNHPSHKLCPGFDAKRPLAKGESYSFTFTEKKTCTMHDHMDPSMTGTIVVE